MKVSELTDDALNRLLHEKVIGECWHETVEDPDARPDGSGPLFKCKKCGARHWGMNFRPEFTRPPYCTDLNAVAKAEAKVIKGVGEMTYLCRLGLVCVPNACGKEMLRGACRATARQRAEAIAIAAGLENEDER